MSDDDGVEDTPNDESVQSDGLASSSTDLVVEADVPDEDAAFQNKLEETLKQAEQDVVDFQSDGHSEVDAESWQRAREIVGRFRPVPGFIWRLSYYVLSKPPGQSPEIGDGMVFGMRRLLYAAASDPLLGSGDKINSVHAALSALQSDTVAAITVVHAVCRRLRTAQFERIWRPILDDAVLRSTIGFLVGHHSRNFGPGRGMLAGFAGRSGLAIQIATGELEQARQALEELALGRLIQDIGAKIYGCGPLQVSAMTLSAAGCGRDAAFGTVAYASPDSKEMVGNEEQLKWLAAFAITEHLRMGEIDKVDPEYWHVLGLAEEELQEELRLEAHKLSRRGPTWSWIF